MEGIENLKGVRTSIRVRTGLTEKGETGDDRLNHLVNLAQRQLWNDQPDVFMKQEIRILLQPAITGTLDICPTDLRVARVSDGTNTTISDTPGFPEVFRARWIDITDSEGVVHTRRILTVGRSTTNQDWGDGAFTRDIIVMDRPYASAQDDLEFRIYTLDYPLPADVVDITAVYRNPEGDGFDELTAVYPAELDRLRLGAWNESGLPEAYSDGDFFQLPPPHQAPTAVALNVGLLDEQKWGYDDDGVEDDSFGAAGEFSYCYCLVWGRIKSPTRDMQSQSDATERELAPFYISAPSEPSDNVSTEWGEAEIVVGTQADGWERIRKVGLAPGGLGMLSDLAPLTGLEKWFFRARHSTNAENGPSIIAAPADGVYRLWKITSASDLSVTDKGDADPPDFSFPLKEFTGHKSIRFDRTPSEGSPVEILIRATVRPPLLSQDTDVLPLPPNAVEAVVNKVCHYLAERDGDLNKATYFSSLYEKQVNSLRESHGWTSTKKPGFGDGITVGGTRSWRMSPKIRAVDP